MQVICLPFIIIQMFMSPHICLFSVLSLLCCSNFHTLTLVQGCQPSNPTALIKLMTYNHVASGAVTIVLFMKCSKLIV